LHLNYKTDRQRLDYHAGIRFVAVGIFARFMVGKPTAVRAIVLKVYPNITLI